MPLTDKGKEILGKMKEQYGPGKGENVFYASANKGTITGIEERKHANKGGLISGFPKLAKKT